MEEYKDYDWLIEWTKEQHKNLIKEKLTEFIGYCRYQQRLFNEEKSAISGNDILQDLLNQGSMELSLVIKIKPLIDDLSLDYTLTLLK
jgi:hypothetical protein